MIVSSELIPDFEFDFSTKLSESLTIHDNWICDKWNIKINGETIEYYTGIGFREVLPLTLSYSRDGVKKVLNHLKPTSTDEMFKIVRQDTKPIPPTLDDIIHSVIMDSIDGMGLFEDFCDNCGYSTDSIKALKAYHACQNMVKKLRKIGLLEKYSIEELYDFVANY